MKNLVKLVGIIAFASIIVFPVSAQTVAERWSKWTDDNSNAKLDYSVADDGVVTVNVENTSANIWNAKIFYHYSRKANTSYTYVFEAWTRRGSRNLAIGYYWDNDMNAFQDERNITITNRRTTYTITGQMKFQNDGDNAIHLHCGDQSGTFFVKVLEIREATPEEIAEAAKFRPSWQKWVADDSRATLDFSVDKDGVVTVNVGGRAEGLWEGWKANISTPYIAKANTQYTYVFEAWTQRGNRDINVEYYSDVPAQIWLNNMILITNKRTTYTITGQAIPKAGNHYFSFMSANQTGRFFINILEIREATPEDLVRAKWGKLVADDSTATLDYSVADDGVVTINIGGKTMPDRWKNKINYIYTGKANTRYTYVFEAWTQRENRDITIQYYGDNVEQLYLHETVSITNRRQIYTVTGQILPKDGIQGLEFQCADQLGIFYLKMLEIREN